MSAARLLRRILDTHADDLPDGLAAQLAEACEPLAEISAAYVARVSHHFASDGLGYESLDVALELAVLPTERVPAHDTLGFGDVIKCMPTSVARAGLHFPSAAGIGVWRKHGVRIFHRSGGDGSEH